MEHEFKTFRAHQISAPPPNEKNERKKELAAKAIDRPNTTWTILRNPPEVSPKASDMPVTVMMMTATIFATGPCTDSRTRSSGASQGMPEPAACAAVTLSSTQADAAPSVTSGNPPTEQI